MNKKLRLIIAIIISIAVVGGIYLFNEYNKEQAYLKQQEELKNMIQEVEPPVSEVVDEEDQEPTILSKYQALYERNNDFVGWVKIEGTKIDYPLVKRDNDYYLRRDFDGKSDQNGTIFIDQNTDLINRTTNVILYGHNIRSGIMFGEIDNYKSEAFFKEHRYINLDTLYAEETYEVIAFFQSQVYKKSDKVFKYYQFYNAENEAEFQYFYDNIKELSLYDTQVEAEFGDVFITFSTCSYEFDNARYVLIAKRID